MRIPVLILLASVLLSCKELEILRYEYQTTTQMGRTVLAVTQDSVTVTFNGRGEPTYWARPVNDTEWEGITASMKNVDLSQVSKLEAPSNKRATDAAPYARFNFVGKDSTITSSDFDAKNPHEMLMPLMNVFLSIQEENQK